jgi:hypothetical protein
MACGDRENGSLINEKEGTVLAQLLLPKFISNEFCAKARCCRNKAINKKTVEKVNVAFIAFCLMVENSFIQGCGFQRKKDWAGKLDMVNIRFFSYRAAKLIKAS